MRYLHQVGSVVRISADLTADTPIPGMEVPFTWQASLELNAKLYSALGQCGGGLEVLKNAVTFCDQKANQKDDAVNRYGERG